MVNTKLYYITDGTRFIWKNNRGKYTPTNGESMADLYSRYEAEKILKGKLNKSLRKTFYLKEAFSEKISITVPENLKKDEVETGRIENNIVKENKSLSKTDIKENTETVFNADYTVQWLRKLEDVNNLYDDIHKRKEILQIDLSQVNGELQDELHYIEFAKCNAYQAWVSWKRLQMLRQKRRSIKNEIQVLDIIINKSVAKIPLDEIIKSIQKLDNRTYIPRTDSELYQ